MRKQMFQQYHEIGLRQGGAFKRHGVSHGKTIGNLLTLTGGTNLFGDYLLDWEFGWLTAGVNMRRQ